MVKIWDIMSQPEQDKMTLGSLTKAIICGKPTINLRRMVQIQKEAKRIIERTDKIIDILQLIHSSERQTHKEVPKRV